MWDEQRLGFPCLDGLLVGTLVKNPRKRNWCYC